MLEKTHLVIDSITGEILQNESTVIKRVTPDEFIQVYLEDFSGMLALNSKTEIQILCMLWKYSKYFEEDDELGNRIDFTQKLRDQIKTKLKIADSTIKNSICSFTKRNLLIKDKKFKSIYYLNPNFFFKGKLADRTKSSKKSIEYLMQE